MTELDLSRVATAELRALVAALAKYSPDQPRVPAGMPGGGQFGLGGAQTGPAVLPRAIERWSNFDAATIRLAAAGSGEGNYAGDIHDAKQKQAWAHAIAVEVANGEPAPELWRGVQAANHDGSSTIRMNLSSWSTDRAVAEQAAGGGLLYRLEAGAKGFNIGAASRLPDEHEWITDGRFAVTSVAGNVVSLRQESVFQPPRWDPSYRNPFSGSEFYGSKSLDPDLSKYSDAQPRDDHGRWTVGGDIHADESRTRNPDPRAVPPTALALQNEPFRKAYEGLPRLPDPFAGGGLPGRMAAVRAMQRLTGTEWGITSFNRPDETARACAALKALQERFPVVRIREVSTENPPTPTAAAWTRQQGDGSSKIGLSSNHFGLGSGSSFGPDNGWHPDGCSTPEGTMTHEFGHALFNHIVRSGPDNLVYQTAVFSLGDRQLNSPLSRYGQADPYENFAEWFSAAYSPGSTVPPERTAEFRATVEGAMAGINATEWGRIATGLAPPKAAIAAVPTEQLIALRGLLAKRDVTDEPRDEAGKWTAGGSYVDPQEAHPEAWARVTDRIAAQGQGNCYEAANTLALQAEKLGLKNGKVVQATCVGQGRIKGQDFGHSWFEADGPHGIRLAYDWSSGNRAVLPAAYYRQLGHARDAHEYSVEDAMKAMARTGHYGPW